MKAKLYKTLEFKDDRFKILGCYAVPTEKGWGGIDIPQLVSVNTTIRKLEKLYPNHNFKDVKLTIVKVSELVTNNT